VAAIVGFGRAVQAISPVHQATMVRLRDRFEQGLNQRFGQRVTIHHHALERTPNTSSVSFSGKDGNTLLIQLDLAGVCASTGSACHSGALGVSPILIACGIKESLAKSTLRFSFSHTNTEDEVDQLLTLLQRLG
jgi:cysteine desulfurase